MGVGARGTGERKTSSLFNKENIIVSFRIEQIKKNGLMFLVIVQFLPFELISNHKSKKSDFKKYVTCCRLSPLQKHLPYRTPMRPCQEKRGSDPRADNLKLAVCMAALRGCCRGYGSTDNRKKPASGVRCR